MTSAYRDSAKEEEHMQKMYSYKHIIGAVLISVFISGPSAYMLSKRVYSKPEHCISSYQRAAVPFNGVNDNYLLTCDTDTHDMSIDNNSWMHCICKNK
jgi:hypothetical protein